MRRAVIIASNGPPNQRRLVWAEKDGARIAQAFASPACGFDEIVESIGKTAADAREKLFAAAESCRAGDTLVVYFAGHGMIDQGDLFLLFENSG